MFTARSGFTRLPLTLAALAWLAGASLALAQGITTPPGLVEVDSVGVVVRNPPAGVAALARLTSDVRRTFGIYPGESVSRTLLEWRLQRVRRLPGVASVDLEELPGVRAGFSLQLTVTIGTAPTAPSAAPRSAGEELFTDQPRAHGAFATYRLTIPYLTIIDKYVIDSR
jgi:hypothetical protein